MMSVLHDEYDGSNRDFETAANFNDLFSNLPPEMLAEIFLYLDPKYRQKLRIVNRFWKFVVDNYYGITLHITNLNWNSVENCNCVKSMILNGFSRDVLYPEIVTRRLTKLEVTDFVAYYSFLPLLEECHMLESLTINCVTFLQKSRLAEYSSSEYMERNGKEEGWLPRLKHFKFVSCTTQGGVYNHITPVEVQDDMYGFEDVTRTSYDISRGEMEFMPFILQILAQAKALAHVEMVLTDIWKIPFTELLRVNVNTPPSSFDISLWHFGSKRLLPISSLLQKLNSIKTMYFSFPYHFDKFFLKFGPSFQQLDLNQPSQLEEIVVQQSFRWSQELSQIDIPWLQILEKQKYLKTLEYPFPIFGNDNRVASVILQNSKTLQRIVFTGHREERESLEDFRGGRLKAWTSDWFASCDNLQELCLKSNTRFLLTPTNIATMKSPHLLPKSLTHFTFHGCVDTGSYALSNILGNLVNLQSFTHQARLCPWFKINGTPLEVMQISHAVDIITSLPKLQSWTLEWVDTSSTVVVHAVVNSQSQAQTACVSKHLLDWMAEMEPSLTFTETSLDRQLKSLTVKVLSRRFSSQYGQ